MTGLSIQVLADFYECDPNILDNEDLIRESMLEAAQKCGATVILHNFHKFSPQGVSGMIIIAESHFAIHTWPEHSYAAVDLFTCGQSIKPEPGLNYLAQVLKSKHQTTNVINRGYQFDKTKKS